MRHAGRSGKPNSWWAAAGTWPSRGCSRPRPCPGGRPSKRRFPPSWPGGPRPVCVLASGDPFCFGIGSTLVRHVPPDEMVCHPAPSAFSLASARLGWAQQDCALVSLCGRPIDGLLAALAPGARLLVLSGDASTPALVAEDAGPARVRTLPADRLRGDGRSARAVAADVRVGLRPHRGRPAEHDRRRPRPRRASRAAGAAAGAPRRLVRERRADHAGGDPRHDLVQAGAATRRDAVGHRRRLGFGRYRMDAGASGEPRDRGRTKGRAGGAHPAQRGGARRPGACGGRRRRPRGSGRAAGPAGDLHRRRGDRAGGSSRPVSTRWTAAAGSSSIR